MFQIVSKDAAFSFGVEWTFSFSLKILSPSRNESGSLFKEILKFDEGDESEPISEDPSLPIDLILQDDEDEEKLIYDCYSTSDAGSDSDDPEYDDTLLRDLFFTDKVGYHSRIFLR